VARDAIPIHLEAVRYGGEQVASFGTQWAEKQGRKDPCRPAGSARVPRGEQVGNWGEIHVQNELPAPARAKQGALRP